MFLEVCTLLNNMIRLCCMIYGGYRLFVGGKRDWKLFGMGFCLSLRRYRSRTC